MSDVRLWFTLLLILICTAAADAKEWRGIIPLQSTKADVERVVGPPSSFGHYEIENGSISVLYSSGRCDSNDQAATNCECFVPKDTVLRIYLTFDSPPTVSSLGFNKAKYHRTPFRAVEPSATYSNFIEGVVYTVSESDNTVTNIDYLPSDQDCQKVIRRHAGKPIKGWQGIVPWRSTRGDVEKILGRPTGNISNVYTYKTATRRVDVAYSNDPCHIDYNRPVVMSDLVLKLTVIPQQRILVRELGLPKDKYRRIQMDHPENWFEYVNLEEGITVEVLTSDRGEEVRSTIYEAPSKEFELRCGLFPKATPGPMTTPDHKRR